MNNVHKPDDKGLFLLIAGVTGAGKTTTIRELIKIDPRYERLIIDTTRPLRIGEKDKRHVTKEQFQMNKDAGHYWGTNFTHGNHYGSPRQPIYNAINSGRVAVSDYAIENADILERVFGAKAHLIYLVPESLEIIESRIIEERRNDTSRYDKAAIELERFHRGEFNDLITKAIPSPTGKQVEIAQKIHAYVQSQIWKEKSSSQRKIT